MTKPPKRVGKAGKAVPKKRVAKKGPSRKSVAGPEADAPAAIRKSPAKKRAVKAAVRQSRGAAARVTDMSGAGAGVLDRLFEVVTSRRDADPNISHSARLLSRGTAKVAQKFGEEAVECLIEAIVLWVDAGLRPGEVWSELQRREGTSGIAERASRPAAQQED